MKKDDDKVKQTTSSSVNFSNLGCMPEKNTQKDSLVFVNLGTKPIKEHQETDNLFQKNIIVTVTPERTEYNKIRLKYQNMAEKLANHFSENWFKDMDDLHERASTVVIGYLTSAVDSAINDLIARGIMDVDEQYFLEDYLMISWEDDFNDIDDKYNAIVLRADELDAYRTARRQSRGRFVGGGFGFDGALNGMAKAGAANLAIGLLHGTFNLGGKAITSAMNAVKKAQLFDDPSTKTSLVNAVYWQISLVHTGLIFAINDKKPNSISGWISEDDELKASRLFENIKKGRISNKDDVQSVLIEALNLNPYDEEVYEYWIKSYGDNNNLLKNTADFFGIKKFSSNKQVLENKTEIYQIESQSDGGHSTSIKLKLGSEEFINQLYRICIKYENIDKKLFVSDNTKFMRMVSSIPEKKLNNAINSYIGNSLKSFMGDSQKVVALYDSTVFGSGNEGFSICTNGIYSKKLLQSPQKLSWTEFSKKSISLVDSKIVFDKDDVTLILSDELEKPILNLFNELKRFINSSV